MAKSGSGPEIDNAIRQSEKSRRIANNMLDANLREKRRLSENRTSDVHRGVLNEVQEDNWGGRTD